MTITPPEFRLYHYWRSSASWRVRWALDLKKIPVEFVHVQLLNGEVDEAPHLKRNPLGLVPVLERLSENDSTKRFLTESLAMILWLEDISPEVPLLPKDPFLKAQTWAFAEVINADTHPLQNLGPQFLHSEDPEKRKAWAKHWIENGLRGYEAMLKPLHEKKETRFTMGDTLSVADLCLVPQIYNALRFNVNLDLFPNVKRLWENAAQEPTFHSSHPDRYEVPVL
jgi:maleylpyruvate isomerase